MKKANFLLGFSLLLLSTLFMMNGCKRDNLSPTHVSPSQSNATGQPDSLVSTPAGPLPKSHVFLIENGYHLDITSGHVLKIETATGNKIADFGVLHSMGASQKPAQNPLIGKIRSLRNAGTTNPGAAVNWETYSQWSSSAGPITSFSTTWIVPGQPTTSTDQQQIFIFNGVAESDNAEILQPVLQWGLHSNDGGGTYWSIANWYVWGSGGDTYAAFSSPITVNPGTSIQGVITYNSTQSNGSLNYTCSFTGYSNPLTIVEGNSNQGAVTTPTGTTKEQVTFPYIENQVWAYETLESYNYKNGTGAYDVYQASDYPAQVDVQMTNISLSVNGSPASYSWTAVTGPNADFGEHTNVINNGEVDLFFHPQPPPASFTYWTPDDLAINQPITALSPTNYGSVPTSYSVSPTLPLGLSMNTTTGVISGTPTQLTPATNYTITGTSIWGNGTFTISIVVGNIYPFVVSSHSSSSTIYNLVFNGNTVTSADLVNSNDINNLNLVYTPNSNSTVVMQAASGYMPVNATLYGNFAPINGTISGRNITFTGVNLNGAQCQIVIN